MQAIHDHFNHNYPVLKLQHEEAFQYCRRLLPSRPSLQETHYVSLIQFIVTTSKKWYVSTMHLSNKDVHCSETSIEP